MDNELNDLLFDIEDTFARLNSRIRSIKRELFVEDGLFYNSNYFKLDINDLIFYTRALRDKLENG